jgi:hypothetical protein
VDLSIYLSVHAMYSRILHFCIDRDLMSLPAGTVSKSGRPGQLLRRGMPGRISLCFAKFAFEDSMCGLRLQTF